MDSPSTSCYRMDIPFRPWEFGSDLPLLPLSGEATAFPFSSSESLLLGATLECSTWHMPLDVPSPTLSVPSTAVAVVGTSLHKMKGKANQKHFPNTLSKSNTKIRFWNPSVIVFFSTSKITYKIQSVQRIDGRSRPKLNRQWFTFVLDTFDIEA